jgi:biopolymer transport protein ExbD
MSGQGSGMFGSGLRRRRAIDSGAMHFGPNMTPMVDVVMVILVFFMASAAYLGPEWFLSGLVPQIAGPAAGSGPGARQAVTGAGGTADPLATPTPRFEFEMERGGDGEIIAKAAGAIGTIQQAADALIATIGPGKDQVEVLIRPGPGVSWGEVVRVTELLRKAGIERVGPVTRSRERQSPGTR